MLLKFMDLDVIYEQFLDDNDDNRDHDSNNNIKLDGTLRASINSYASA